jgi:hypothetical protein
MYHQGGCHTARQRPRAAARPRRASAASVLLLVSALLCLLSWEASAQSSAPVEAIATAPVTLDGERLFAVRGTSAVPAEERAQVIRERLLAAARDPAFDPADLALEPIDGGVAIRTADHLLLGVYEADAEVEGVDTRVLAASMMSRLSRAVLDHRAARGPEGVRDAMRVVGIETLVLAGALLAIFLLERLSGRLIHRYVDGRVAAWEARARDVVRLQGVWRRSGAAFGSPSSPRRSWPSSPG